MQVRFLELLEGLPEEVQSALLENAYRDACVAKEPMLDLRLTKSQDNDWWVIGLINKDSERDGYEPISKSRLSKLEAWRDAYERLSK